MAVLHSRVTVDTSADLIIQAVGTTHSVVVKNGGSVSVFLGDSSITANQGYELVVGGEIALDLKPGDALYGITAASSVVVQVLGTK